MNFGGIEALYSSFDDCVFAVLPVPYDLTSTYQAGSRKGPSAILEASANMELYDEELKTETYRSGIHTLMPLEIDARGPREMIDRVKRATAELLKHDKVPVVLGGEHTVTIGAVEAMKEFYPGISVLHLDAHADMRDSYQQTRYSHACVARRLHEICPVVQAGIRSMSSEEAHFLELENICSMSPEEMTSPDVIKMIMGELTTEIYVSVDLDVFDPSVMPSTGTPEPGGVQWKDVIRLIREVSNHRIIRGFDIVELCPIPGFAAPDFMAAKLTYRMMGYVNNYKIINNKEIRN
ncbi:MAG: agmatinase [Syntrophales bacterium]|jgi:agmatinase|nr:agmatinase [Syntrophales bacterium]MDY0045589.1 agmatinase [Syntrophales bacterium]